MIQNSVRSLILIFKALDNRYIVLNVGLRIPFSIEMIDFGSIFASSANFSCVNPDIFLYYFTLRPNFSYMVAICWQIMEFMP